MASWDHQTCGNCGDELPLRGYKRKRVPGKGLRNVCEPCAKLIDRQGSLEEELVASGSRDSGEGEIPF